MECGGSLTCATVGFLQLIRIVMLCFPCTSRFSCAFSTILGILFGSMKMDSNPVENVLYLADSYKVCVPSFFILCFVDESRTLEILFMPSLSLKLSRKLAGGTYITTQLIRFQKPFKEQVMCCPSCHVVDPLGCLFV